jgi:hypothetical protein
MKMPKYKTTPILTFKANIQVTLDHEFEECCSEKCSYFEQNFSSPKNSKCLLLGPLKLVKKKSEEDGEIEIPKRHKNCLEGKPVKKTAKKKKARA